LGGTLATTEACVGKVGLGTGAETVDKVSVIPGVTPDTGTAADAGKLSNNLILSGFKAACTALASTSTVKALPHRIQPNNARLASNNNPTIHFNMLLLPR
jgi:hypothetical protein